MIAVALALELAACTPTPEQCRTDQTFTGAMLGAGIGGALGTVGSIGAMAAGGVAPGAGVAIAAGSTLAGAVVGTLIGLHRDNACHQMALNQALDQAVMQNMMPVNQQQPLPWEFTGMQPMSYPQYAGMPIGPQPPGSTALPPPPEAGQQSPTPSSAHAGPVGAPATPPATPPGPRRVYRTVAWSDPSNRRFGAITPLSNLTESASERVCMTYNDQQISGGTAQAVTGTACRNADGTWTPVP